MHYSICPINPAAHLFFVTCEVSAPDPAGQMFSLPAWIPGSYMIREFAKNIVSIKAFSAEGEIGLSKVDKSTWRTSPATGPLRLEYEVYAWDLSVRSAHLDMSHAYFNGTSVFVRVHGREDEVVSVEIMPPACVEGWRVATSMGRAGAEPYGFGRYCAANYDELIDHPVEMGQFTLASFDVAGVLHDVVITGRHKADMERLCRDLKRICETQVGFFGELPEMERYLFLVMAVGDGYGGLEHRSSCSLVCSRNDLPQPGMGEMTESYRTFLGLCSHEYFHTWNVKRIKPDAFVPYDLEREVYTRQLWAFEGITSYYDDLMLLRSGVIGREAYLDLVAQTMTRVWSGSGRFKQSVADSSFDAWTKFYRQDENAPNAIVSYYTKGSLIALALDLLIRRHSGGLRSLDDVMRRLWSEYGKSGIGVPEGGVERISAEVAGISLDEFFSRHLYGTEDLPLAELLAAAGVEFRLRPALSPDDKGGKAGGRGDAPPKPVLGAKYSADGAGVKLVNLYSGGAAELAGLAAGDVIVAIDHLKVSNGGLAAMLGAYRAGDVVTVHAFRRDELITVGLQLQAPPADRIELSLMAECDAEALQRRDEWLGSAA